MTDYNATRYPLELAACGITKFTGFLEGVPQFSPALTAGETTIKNLIDAAHVATDGACGVSGYLDTNLLTGAANIALKAALTTNQWNAYKGLQKATIDALIREKCREANGVWDAMLHAFMEAANPSAADLGAAQATYAVVKALYPYPTSY